MIAASRRGILTMTIEAVGPGMAGVAALRRGRSHGTVTIGEVVPVRVGPATIYLGAPAPAGPRRMHGHRDRRLRHMAGKAALPRMAGRAALRRPTHGSAVPLEELG